MPRPSLRPWALCLALAATSLAAQAAPVKTTYASSIATAQVINASSFTLDNKKNVADSTIIPHVEISATSRATAGRDYYRFTTAGGVTHMDIDGGTFDSVIGLWDISGKLLYSADNSGWDPGSENLGNDAGWWGMNLTAGDYYIGVCRNLCRFADGFSMAGVLIRAGDSYVLNISTQAVAAQSVPEPASWALALLALVGAGAGTRAVRRRV